MPGFTALVMTVAAAATVATAAAGCSGASGGSGSGTAGDSASALQKQYEEVVRDVLPSVVQISTPDSTGSGVVYDSQGDIVTNEHVVGDAKTVQVQESVGNHSLTAKVVGEFAPDDLAVIRVTKALHSELKPARFANSDDTQIGEIVLAMGNPLGLTDSVTQGIISATGRTVGASEANGGQALITAAIQTSAAINPGNSGGALVNLDDQVVGVPTLAARLPDQGGAAPGIGFAIPSDTVQNIADQLIKSGKVTTLRPRRHSTSPRRPRPTRRAGRPASPCSRVTGKGGAAARRPESRRHHRRRQRPAHHGPGGTGEHARPLKPGTKVKDPLHPRQQRRCTDRHREARQPRQQLAS